MARKDDTRDAMLSTESGLTPDADDAEGTRLYEHGDAQRVRDGELSAAQLEGGGATIDPRFPDAQYPPGIVDTAAAARAEMLGGIDPAETVPEPGPAFREGTSVDSPENIPY